MSRMKIFSRPLALLGALALGLGVVACGGSEDDTPADPPEIVNFEATPDAVSLGGEVELRWQTRHAKQVRILDGRNMPVDTAGAPVGEGSVMVKPSTSTSYRLIAVGEDDTSVFSEDKPVRIIPFPSPTIESFTISLDEVGFGAPTTLAWATTNAVSVSISDNFGRRIDLGDAEAGEGSVEVRPKADSTYTLKAVGRSGDSTTAEVSVRIAQSPSVSIKAKKSTIVYGEITELVWSATLADHVVVQAEGGAPLVDTESKSGTVEVQPTQSTIYVITATGKGGTESASVPVFVAPQIRSFNQKVPGPVRPGDDIVVEWEVVGATELTITNEGGNTYQVPNNQLVRGSMQVRVANTGMFNLIARSGNAESRQHLSLELTPEPAIRTFEATPSTVFQGDETTLSWFVDGASLVSIEARPDGLPEFSTGTFLEMGRVSPRQDSFRVVVDQGTTFRLRAKTGVYETQQDVHVDVH